MTVKALRKQLMAAIAMVVVAAVALSSSTYAWFAANTEVTANGMQVSAKADNTFLLISADKTSASEIQQQGLIVAGMNVNNPKLYPSAPATDATMVEYLSVADGHNKVGGGAIATAGEEVVDENTANAVTNWYTASAKTVDAATIKADTALQLVSFEGYVIKKTVTLTVAAGSSPVENLTVKPEFTQAGSGNDIGAVKVVITTSDNGFAIVDSTRNNIPVDIKGSNTVLTDTTTVTVNMYIYYDGNNDSVYTNNAANLTGASIVLKFGATMKAGS